MPMSSKDSSPCSRMDSDKDDQDSRGKRKESAGASETTSQPKKKKILPTRSNVWDHYTRQKENRDKCICHYCQKEFSCSTKSGTSSLTKHLGVCKQYKAWKDGQSEIQQVINEEGNLKTAKVNAHVFREATNEMLVLGELPLSFIESVAWKHFCSKVNLYKPHSRRTSTRDIVEMYVQRKANLKKWFLTNKQRVSVTTDIWGAQTTGASYMVVTMHYVDPYWRLKKLIIGFKHITDHKGQTISTVLLECLADWGIEKVFCITVDNATANSCALRKFQNEFSLVSADSLVLGGDFMHVRCSGHIINLIVKDGLAAVDENVSVIRNAVTYVRSSPNRLKSFESKVESGKVTRGSLPLDVKTRWNSTYLMLMQSLKFKVAFDKLEAEDKLYNDYFLEFDNGTKRIGPPQFTDWKAVERLARFLLIFYHSTLVVSASSALNAHKCYGELVTIATNLISLSHSLDSDLKSKAVDMLKKFDKYWDGVKNINKMLIIATVFDPTKKMELAKTCFEELYGADTLEAKEMYDSVINVLRSMFIEYNGRYGKVSDDGHTHSRTQTLHSQSSQSSREQSLERLDLVDDGFGYRRIDRIYKEKLNEIGVKYDELETYLNESVENPDLLNGVEYDVLSWWRRNCVKFPVLSEIARDVLAMQVSSVASESAFSTSGRIIDPYRSCLTHYMVEVLMCTDQWMKQEIKCESRLLTNAQILADIEEEEKLEREFETSITQTG